jgi:hypothetical protein
MISERLMRIEQYNIKVSFKGKMLKAIIEEDHLSTELLGQDHPFAASAGNDDHCLRIAPCQQDRLITNQSRIVVEKATAIRNQGSPLLPATAVTATDNSDTFSGFEAAPDQDIHDRRLAGASNGQVADGKHRNRCPVGLHNPQAVSMPAEGHQQTEYAA